MAIALGAPAPDPRPAYARRALAHWPRLDRARLRRAGSDPVRIARLVERRSTLSREEIVAILEGAAPATAATPATPEPPPGTAR